jgi:hypothetical protein
MEVTMSHIVLWLVIVVAYFCLVVLICKCMNLGDRKYKKVTPAMNRRRWTGRAAPETAELPERTDAKSAHTNAA